MSATEKFSKFLKKVMTSIIYFVLNQKLTKQRKKNLQTGKCWVTKTISVVSHSGRSQNRFRSIILSCTENFDESLKFCKYKTFISKFMRILGLQRLKI
jgi:hypothetical protein